MGDEKNLAASEFDDEFKYARTMSIIGELRKGKQFPLPDGLTLAMGEDFSIGYVLKSLDDGSEMLGGLVDLSIKELSQALDFHNVGIVIPDLR